MAGTIENQDTTLLANIWPTFNVDSDAFDVTECAQAGDSLAIFTLNQYGIPYRPSGYDGGPLTSIDIKRMDAMTLINQSLMEEFSAGYIVEPIVDEEGYVEFVQIGSPGGGISDVYYTVQTHTYSDTAKGVMITGGRPLPLRRAVEFKPIWGEGENNSARTWIFQDMLANCNLAGFTRYATITFDDPLLDINAYNDGRVNLFEPSSPWDRYLGFVYYDKVPETLREASPDYTVSLSKTATVPIRIGGSDTAQGNNNGGATLVEDAADMGQIQTLPQYDPATNSTCWSDANQGESVDYTKGVKVDIRTSDYNNLSYTNIRGTIVDKFVSISSVFVVGKQIDYLKSAPATEEDAIAAQAGEAYNYRIWAWIEDTQRRAFRLQPGKNYSVSYDTGEENAGGLKTPYIIFAQEVKADDPAIYGTKVPFYIDQTCKFARENDGTEVQYEGSILPIEQNRGILVEQIYVLLELESPSLVINDPNGNAADIADQLIYYVAPLVVYTPPAPIGYAGSGANGGVVVDQTTGINDNDPTTAISFDTESELERYYDQMQGGGMALTLSFLDENNVDSVAAKLYKYLQFTGVTSVTTCGPCAAPKLGRYGTSGVINSIQYSYSDKGSYTISVQEGPYIIGGLTPVDGGPTQKMTEEHQATGTIIADAGNGAHFKVLIDGYGERWAMSMVPHILRVGDIVSVTVHNNPVEA